MPESTEAAPVAAPTKTVTLAWPYDVIEDGEVVKTLEPDTDVGLPEHEANRLLLAGLARLPAVEEPAGKTSPIKDVLADVGTDAEKAATALEAEKAGAARPTLIAKLEAIANAGQEN